VGNARQLRRLCMAFRRGLICLMVEVVALTEAT
jgi:hypothetical protein